MDIKWESNHYSNMTTNEKLAQLYQQNAQQLGRDFPSREEQEVAQVGSTDMGNVSKVVPSIHPFYDIQTNAANHTKEFREAAGKPEAHEMTLIQAKILVHTALDVLCDEHVWKEIQAGFDRTQPTVKVT